MTEAPPIVRDSLASQVARYVQGHIVTHGLKPGAVLPSELDVSRDLGVSRGVVREAFRSMAAAGIVEIANGRRPRVGGLNERVLSDFFRHALATEQARPEQVLEVRRSLEIGAAWLAAGHRQSAHVAELQALLEDMRTTLSEVDHFVQHDMRLHLVIAESTGNPLFVTLITSIRRSIEESIRVGMHSRRSAAELDRVHRLHVAIVDAIAAQDPAAAGIAMERHFDDAVAAILNRGVARRQRTPSGQTKRGGEPVS